MFHMLRTLHYELWGIHFHIKVDAKFLKETINSPSLPNAPMTRWISFIQLFDFELVHIPTTKHQATDGLSGRPHATEDSENSDEELDTFKSGLFIMAAKMDEPANPEYLQLNMSDCIVVAATQLHLSPNEFPNVLKHRTHFASAFFHNNNNHILYLSLPHATVDASSSGDPPGEKRFKNVNIATSDAPMDIPQAKVDQDHAHKRTIKMEIDIGMILKGI